jgi:hypothetical protein
MLYVLPLFPNILYSIILVNLPLSNYSEINPFYSTYKNVTQNINYPYEFYFEDSFCNVFKSSNLQNTPELLGQLPACSKSIFTSLDYQPRGYLLTDSMQNLLFIKPHSKDIFQDSIEIYSYNDHNFNYLTKCPIISKLYCLANGTLLGISGDIQKGNGSEYFQSNLKLISSTDKGLTWNTIYEELPDSVYLQISLIINSNGSNIILWQYEYEIVGDMFISYDSGETFSRIQFNENQWQGIITHPISNFADSSTEIFVADKMGIHYSKDPRSELFELINLPESFDNFKFPFFHPTDSNMLILYKEDDYILISYDKGKNWNYEFLNPNINYGSINPISNEPDQFITSSQLHFTLNGKIEPISGQDHFKTLVLDSNLISSLNPFNILIFLGPRYDENLNNTYQIYKYDNHNNWLNFININTPSINYYKYSISPNGDVLLLTSRVHNNSPEYYYSFTWSNDFGSSWHNLSFPNYLTQAMYDDICCLNTHLGPIALIAPDSSKVLRIDLNSGIKYEISIGLDINRKGNKFQIVNNNQDIILYATNANKAQPSNLVVSHDDGLTWQPIPINYNNETFMQAYDVSFNPMDPTNYIVVVKNFDNLISEQVYHILETKDNGLSWENTLLPNELINKNLNEVNVDCVLDASDFEIRWFINTKNQIFTRLSSNPNWDLIFSNSIENISIVKIFYQYYNSNSIIILDVNGILYNVSDFIEIKDLPKYKDLQIFLNHGNIYLNSSYEVKSLSLFSLSGSLIRTFDIKQDQSSIPWHGTDNKGNQLPSGIYFARAEDEHGNVATTKVVLVR